MRLHEWNQAEGLCDYYATLSSEALRARLLIGDSNEELKDFIRYILSEREAGEKIAERSDPAKEVSHD